MEMKAIESLDEEVESDELYSRLIEVKYSLDQNCNKVTKIREHLKRILESTD